MLEHGGVLLPEKEEKILVKMEIDNAGKHNFYNCKN